MYGVEDRKVPAGAISHACQHCTVTSPTSFVNRRRIYDAPDGEPLQLRTGPLLDLCRGMNDLLRHVEATSLLPAPAIVKALAEIIRARHQHVEAIWAYGSALR